MGQTDGTIGRHKAYNDADGLLDVLTEKTGRTDRLSNLEKLLTPEEVAAVFGVSLETLRTWRKKKRGPRPVHVGRLVRYPESAVTAHIEALKQAS